MRLTTVTTWLALASVAPAGPLTPINPNQPGRVTTSTVDAPVVEWSTVPSRTVPSTTVVPGVMRSESQWSAPVRRNDSVYRTRSYSQVPSRTVPTTNFSAKRSGDSDRLLPREEHPTGQAPIHQRVIRANTSEGAEELKEQLRDLPIRR